MAKKIEVDPIFEQGAAAAGTDGTCPYGDGDFAARWLEGWMSATEVAPKPVAEEN